MLRLAGFAFLAFMLCGCPVDTLDVGVSEWVHDFRDDECLWTFYVYSARENPVAFRAISKSNWAKVLNPVGVAGPGRNAPISVWIDRRALGKSDAAGELELDFGIDGEAERFVSLYATHGTEDLVRLRDYWPLAEGNTWTYAALAENVGGADGDRTLVDVSRLTVTGHCVRYGIDVWEVELEELETKRASSLFMVFLNEVPVFTDSSEAVAQLPNTDAFYEEAFAGDFLHAAWLQGVFEPAMDGLNSNTTRYTTAVLGDNLPMRVGGTTRYRAGDFPVRRSTPCIGLYDDPGFDPRRRKFFFQLLGRGVGPLLDPFGSRNVLHSFQLADKRP